MESSKKTLLTVIGIAILVISVVGVAFAFFNYTRTGANNSIRVGRIYFNSEEGQAINLTNLFPIDVSEGIPNDATKVGTLTINIKGDTEYNGGIEYLVSAVNVTNTSGSGNDAKRLPISISVSVENNSGNNPVTTLGNADADYFSDRGPSAQTSIYKVLATGAIETDSDILVGYIKEGSTGVDGNIVIKAYIDKARVAITDTYPEETIREVKTTGYSSSNCETVLTGVSNASTYCASAASLQTAIDNESLTNAQITLLINAGIVSEYTNGTSSEWVGDREVFTTAEWNALQQSGISFKIKVVANEGIWVENPVLCKRVINSEDLHTKTCGNTLERCASDGYTGSNATITYGNAKAKGQPLATGDAFDCDVNGNGIIDTDNGVSTERFYYVSPYYNTDTKTFDNTSGYATLIYYKNFKDGLPSDSGAAYALKADIQSAYPNDTISTDDNWHGPVTAATHLPTTSIWSNVELKTTSRTILACGDDDCSTPVLTTNMYYGPTITIVNPFSYVGKAARLLTLMELNQAGCDTLSGETSLGSTGALKACNFILEGTQYDASKQVTDGVLLETPSSFNNTNVYIAHATSRDLSTGGAFDPSRGVRPAIDVPYSKLEY